MPRTPTTLTLTEARHLIRARGGVSESRLAALSPEGRRRLEADLVAWVTEDTKRHQLEFYRPVTRDARDAEKIHLATAREVGVQGGRRGGKTGTVLAEAVIQAIGLVPRCLQGRYPERKLRGREHPASIRIGVTSLISAWDNNLKQKLQWWCWNGRLNEDGLPGDPRHGHWGWIPPEWLIHQNWDESWSEKHRTLTLWHPERNERWSTFQLMSYDQSLTEWNQGAFDLIVEDEIPPEEIHRANRLRVIEKSGQMYVGGTPPDDRSGGVAVAWFFDQIIAPGLEGSDPDAVMAVILPTDENRTLDRADIAHAAKGLTDEQRRASLRGEAIHLSGLIIKGFTEKPKTWCPRCDGPVYASEGACLACGGRDVMPYCHVWDDADMAWPGPERWPVLFYMDPHQAKPTACAWYRVDPQDAWWQIHEAEIAGDAATVKREVEAFERRHELTIAWRKADPKITVQTNQFAREFDGEKFTIRRAFEEAGFDFEEANTNFTVAIDRIQQALKVNPLTRAPRLRVHRSCTQTIYHLTHMTWETSRRGDAQNVKEKPARRHSDFVALTRYLAMDDPEWRMLQHLARMEPFSMVQRTGKRSVTGW